MTAATLEWSWPAFLLAVYVVGATANHSLFLAIHEISHNLAFRNRHCNKLLGILANLPIGIPYSVTFKPYHVQHHRYQVPAHMRRRSLVRPGVFRSRPPATGEHPGTNGEALPNIPSRCKEVYWT